MAIFSAMMIPLQFLLRDVPYMMTSRKKGEGRGSANKKYVIQGRLHQCWMSEGKVSSFYGCHLWMVPDSDASNVHSCSPRVVKSASQGYRAEQKCLDVAKRWSILFGV